MIPNLEQTLIQKIHVLPPEKQAKVLAFIEQLEAEISVEEVENTENTEDVFTEKP
jgi:argininosuccinate lyase